MRILSKGANKRLWEGKGDELEREGERKGKGRMNEKANKSSFRKLTCVYNGSEMLAQNLV